MFNNQILYTQKQRSVRINLISRCTSQFAVADLLVLEAALGALVVVLAEDRHWRARLAQVTGQRLAELGLTELGLTQRLGELRLVQLLVQGLDQLRLVQLGLIQRLP